MHLRFSHDSCFSEKCVRCPLLSSDVLLLTGESRASPVSQVAVGCAYPFSFAKKHHVDQYCFIKEIDSTIGSTNITYGHLHLRLALKFEVRRNMEYRPGKGWHDWDWSVCVCKTYMWENMCMRKIHMNIFMKSTYMCVVGVGVYILAVLEIEPRVSCM